MRQTISISLPDTLKKKLDQAAKKEHASRSDIVREALREHFAVQEFRRLRGLMLSEAEKKGIYSDEDVFRLIS